MQKARKNGNLETQTQMFYAKSSEKLKDLISFIDVKLSLGLIFSVCSDI